MSKPIQFSKESVARSSANIRLEMVRSIRRRERQEQGRSSVEMLREIISNIPGVRLETFGERWNRETAKSSSFDDWRNKRTIKLGE